MVATAAEHTMMSAASRNLFNVGPAGVRAAWSASWRGAEPRERLK
jgi:hypothetical protein